MGDDIREEEDVAANNRHIREEDEYVWSFLRRGHWPAHDLNLRQMLRLHNIGFCNAAMQQYHGRCG